MLYASLFPRWVTACVALIAAMAATTGKACTMARFAEWPIKLDRGHVVVDGKINGQGVRVMLDTGAGTMILRTAADRLGLLRRPARGYRSFGIGGETYVEFTNVDDFQIGDMMRKNWRVMVAGEHDFGKSVDVVLGEDFLDAADIEFDLPHGVVRLFRAEGCERDSIAYWATQGASEVDLVPAYDSGPRIIVPVQINGNAITAELDSGSNVSVLDQPVAARLGIRPNSPGVTFAGKGGGFGGKSVDFWLAPVKTFTIGGETISDTFIGFADLWKDATYSPPGSHLAQKITLTPAMLLGADFLRAHRVLVSHSQRKMYFTYEGGPVFQPKPSPQASGAPADEHAPGTSPLRENSNQDVK